MNLNEQASQPYDPSYRLIRLTQGQFAKVDAEDFGWLSRWKWHAWRNPTTLQFYAVRNRPKGGDDKPGVVYMHRADHGSRR